MEEPDGEGRQVGNITRFPETKRKSEGKLHIARKSIVGTELEGCHVKSLSHKRSWSY